MFPGVHNQMRLKPLLLTLAVIMSNLVDPQSVAGGGDKCCTNISRICGLDQDRIGSSVSTLF
jgi:hypothetical protein